MTDFRTVARRQVAQWLPVASRKAGRLAGVLGAVCVLWAGALKAQETSLTIYQDGRVLVRRAVPVQVPRGSSTLLVDLGARPTDIGSLVALDDGVQLKRVTGVTGPNNQLSPRVQLSLESAEPLQALRLAFLTEGLRWRAAYALVVRGQGRATFSGQAIIDNTGQLTMRGAEVQLLAGDVRRTGYSPQPMLRGVLQAAVTVTGTMEAAGAQVVGETRVYTLPEGADFVAGETSTIALVPGAEVPVQPEYLLRPSRFGYTAQWTQPEQNLRAEISYLLQRQVGTPFGSRPLPAGVVRVFTPDSAGRLQLVGETTIDHTPPGKELHITTGGTFDITAERTQVSFERRSDRDVVSSYRVVLHNAKDQDVTVQVLDEFPGQVELQSSSVAAQRLSAASLRFPVPVPAGGEATLEYRVRVKW